ncbi:hypothetical protein OB69_12165, partial [Roseivirga seohaensis subsp. aquiponti]
MRITKSLGKSILLCFFLLLSTSSFKLKTEEGPDAPISNTLTHGDIAFIGVNEDPGPTSGRDHSFTWVALKDIPAGEVIYFTEEGWRTRNTDTGVDANFTPSGYWVGTSEGHFKWTAPAGGLPKGSIVHIYETGTDVMNVIGGGTVSGILAGTGWSLSTGDQVIAYQTSTGARPAGVVPTFLAAIHLDDGLSPSLGYDATTGWSGLTENGGSAYSNVPPGLTNGFNCISLFNPNDSRDYENDNVRYKGITTGTKSQLMRAINSDYALGAGNWEGNNSAAYDITSSGYSAFTVSPNSSSSTGSLAGATVEFVELTSTKTVNNSDDNLLGAAADYNVEFQIGSIKNLYVDIDESTLTLAGRNGSTINANVINFNFSGGTYGAITGASINTLESSVNTTGLSISHTANSVTITGLLNFDFSNNVTIGAVVFNIVTSGAAADNTAPVFENLTPVASSITRSSFILSADIDESGTIYYVVVPDGSSAPTSTEVKNGQSSGGGAVSASGNETLNSGDFSGSYFVLGLTESTAYDVYVVAEDQAGNVQASPTKVDITTTNSPMIVNTATDVVDAGDGLFSLREAITISNANSYNDEVEFDAAISGSTITLNGTQLSITNGIRIKGDINGDYKADITIDAASNSRVFQVSGGTVELASLKITGGSLTGSNNGGGIYVSGNANLTVDASTISNNSVENRGGGFYSESTTTVSIKNSLITENSAKYGSIVITGTGTVDNTTIAYNTADGIAGLHVHGSGNAPATVTLSNSTLTGNKANNFEELLAEPSVQSATINISNSIIANTGGAVNILNAGTINFSGTVVVSEAFTPSSGSATVEANLADIFASTEANGTVTGGELADNGGAVETVATVSPYLGIGATIYPSNPEITGVSLASDNSYIDITFSAGVYSTNAGNGALQDSDFNISLTGGVATSPVISSVTDNSGGVLSGGETVIRINFTYTNVSNGAETLTVNPTDASSIFSSQGFPAAASQSDNTATLNDITAPTVTSVSSSKTNGTYSAGEVILVTVTFSEAVTVTGTPQITLETGTTDRTVNYSSGSGTNTLTFNYTVQSGDVSADLDYVATNSLALNGGTIKDGAGNNATLTLATPGAANSLGANKALVIDAVAPTVTSVSSSKTNGSYSAGEVILVTVTFSESVTVSGFPQIELETGTTDRTANYFSGSGGSTLTFNYIVQAGDVSSDLDYVATNSLALNGGTIKDAAGNNATLTLATPGAANSLGANKALVIDAVAPVITSLSLHNGNTFVEIFASEGLYNTNGGSGALEISDIAISISGGSATNPVITSLKKVDGTTDLTGGENIIRVTFTTTGVADGSEVVKIDFADGSSVFDAAGNAASATQSNNTRILNDLIKPSITGVSLAADNSYIDVTFNEGVYEDNCAGGGLQASDFNLSINNGTATTPVISSVKKNDNTAEGSATALSGGETVVRIFFSVTGTPDGAETLEVDLQANAVFDQNGLTADANQTTNNTASLNDKVVPTVLEVTSNATNGTFKVGDNINIYVQYSEEVLVTGTPQLELETGTTDRTINYVDRSVSTLRFVYTVQAGDVSADLDVTSSTALSLNGGTIKDAAGNNASLTVQQGATGGSLASNKALVIDGVVPTVTSVSSATNNGTYNAGDAVAVTVTFSEAVTVTGIPQIKLETGATDRAVNYTSGSGSNTLTFNYTVQSGDVSADLDYVATNSLTLNSGTIKDASGNDATLTLATPGAANSLGANKAIVVDAVLPTVTSVSVPANATYVASQNLDFTVNFSENVTVVTTGGTPQLSITIGSTTRQAVYQSGSGTSALLFRYVVQSGELDTDGITVGTLSANGGTLKDAATNDANLTLNSVGATTAVLVDGVAPTVINVTSSTSDGTYKVGDQVNVQVVFSEVIYVNTLSQIQLQLETGTLDYYIAAVSGSGTNTLNFTYTVQAGTESSDLDYKATNSLDISLSGTAKDAAGNDAVLTLPAPGAANSLGANKAIVIDGIAPVITSVSSTKVDGSYGLGESIPITVTFDEALTVTGTPQLELETGVVDRKVDYSSGTGTNTLTFNYTVQMGDESADLDYKATNALTLNGGTIKDAAGNDA